METYQKKIAINYVCFCSSTTLTSKNNNSNYKKSLEIFWMRE